MRRIGLLSDTHGMLSSRVFNFFESVDEIWHAGDIGNAETADRQAAYKPLRATYGNIDDHIVRRMFPADQRFFREEGGWNSHLENTKQFIIKAIENTDLKRIAILGSGWLLDVPIENIVRKFEKVYLIDINHPVQIQQKTANYKNVELIEADISTAIEPTYNFVNSYKKPQLRPQLNDLITAIELNSQFFLSDIFDSTYIISVNLLNQLDILISDYVKKFSIFNSTEIIELKRVIQNKHLSFLKQSKACIISDYEELLYNSMTQHEQTNSLVYIDLPDGKRQEKWQWEFDTTESYYPSHKTIFNVIAIEI